MATKVNQLSNNNYFIVMLLITLLVIGGAGVGAKMLLGTIMHEGKVLDAKNKANDQLTKNIQNAPQLMQAYEQLGDRRQLIANALPNTSDLPGLMALMENMSSVSGVTMKSIGAGTTAATTIATTEGSNATASKTSGAQEYPFTMAFDGSYPTLLKLLEGMEKSARPMRVTSLQLSGSGSTLTVQMSASTYYQDAAKLPIKKEVLKK